MTEIETERLTLRRYCSEDAGLIHRLIGDSRVFFWRTKPDNEPSLRVIHRLALPYIEDRMHANLTHRFFALTREAYISAHSDARQKA